MSQRGTIARVVAVILVAGCSAHAPPRRAEIAYQEGFEDRDALRSWQGAGHSHIRLAKGVRGSTVLRVARPASEGAGDRTTRTALPLDELRGTRVAVEAMVKAESVARPPEPWNGIECMLHTVAPSGARWAQQNGLFGTFDWKRIRFVTRIPHDATEAWLVLGLEKTSGRVWFDDVSITVIGGRQSARYRVSREAVFKGHRLPRLRGAQVGPDVTEADLRVLGGRWHANHVRWQLRWSGATGSPAEGASVEQYNAWLDSALGRLDRLLPVCEKLGIKVLVALHTPPGGRNEASECRLFHDRRFQGAFIAIWEKIARRYRGNETVWGYDLLNEPIEGTVPDALLDWRALATKAARRIRRLDPDHTLVVEPAPGADPASLEGFEPLEVPGVVYSVHMYEPHEFTHQGVRGRPMGIDYPGHIDGKYWDRGALRRALQPAIDYQRDYGVHIYIGEFSAIRWAPGESADYYLRDCIEIFEANGWDWAYHAFREWNGWSVEHGPERGSGSPTRTPTARQLLLRSWYAKNRDSP